MRLQNGTWSGVTSEGLALAFDGATMFGMMFKPETNQTVDAHVIKIGTWPIAKHGARYWD
ncbi:MAG: hypothetical protein PGN37_13580 [Mycobacterium kyogaense]|uniref:hypothetical protein n=1 Tax=Mycobacterium kyogaense TaxID=2212479 RepID=UPI002FF6BE9C